MSIVVVRICLFDFSFFIVQMDRRQMVDIVFVCAIFSEKKIIKKERIYIVG